MFEEQDAWLSRQRSVFSRSHDDIIRLRSALIIAAQVPTLVLKAANDRLVVLEHPSDV